MLQRKPSMPTISTVFFQSPALPTISHLPVTVTGAFDVELDALFEFVFVAGLLLAVALFAGVLVEFTATLPEQPIKPAASSRPTSNNALFIKCFLLVCG